MEIYRPSPDRPCFSFFVSPILPNSIQSRNSFKLPNWLTIANKRSGNLSSSCPIISLNPNIETKLTPSHAHYTHSSFICKRWLYVDPSVPMNSSLNPRRRTCLTSTTTILTHHLHPIINNNCTKEKTTTRRSYVLSSRPPNKTSCVEPRAEPHFHSRT